MNDKILKEASVGYIALGFFSWLYGIMTIGCQLAILLLIISLHSVWTARSEKASQQVRLSFPSHRLSRVQVRIH